MPEVADLWVSLRAVTAPFTTALAAAGTEAERAALQVKALQTEIGTLNTRMTRLATRSDAAATSLLQLTAESEGAATGLAATSTEARTAATSLSATATSASEAGAATEAAGTKAAGMGSALASAAKWGALALGAAGVASVVMASKFDAAMTQLNTQAGVSKDKLAGLKDGVLQLAGQVGFSPDSLAEALFHVESNFESMGISSKKALELTKIAAEGAAVGHADLVDVTNALTAAVASGIPGVENMSQAMGMLNAVVGAGDMKMQDLAAAFGSGMVATVKGFGLSLTDVGAALAVFGDNNIRGANAGTQLRMSVMALANPIKGSEAALHTLGLTQDTLAKDMQQGGLKLALEDLSDRMKKAGISADQQGQVITEAFGRKAGAGLNVLLSQMDRLESKYPAIQDGAGKFGDAWTTTTQTLSQQLKDIRFGFDAVMIRIGSFLLPYVSKSITAIEGFGKRAVKTLTDLWDIYGPAIKDKLAAGAGSVAAGSKALLAPLKSELTSLAVAAIPLAITGFDKLKAKLREVKDDAKPAVDGLHAMYDSATSGGGALDTLAQRLKAGATVIAGLTVGLGSTTSLLRPLGQIVGEVAQAFAGLPGPIQLSLLAMVALRPFRPQIEGMRTAVADFGRSAVGSFNNIRGAIEAQQLRAAEAGITLGRFGAAFAEIETRVPVVHNMAESFRNTSARIEEAGGKLVGFRSNVGGVVTALGTGAKAGLLGAFKGLWSFLGGGWGVAIGFAMQGLDMLAKSQQEAAAAAEAHRQRISSLASALKDSNGVMTASVRATAVQTLADAKLKDGKTSLLDTMHKVGVDTNTLTNAYTGNGSSIDSLREKLLAAAEQNKVWVASGKGSIQVYNAVGQANKAAYDALGPLNGEMASSASRAKELADAMAGGSDAAQRATTPMGQLKSVIKTLSDNLSTADDKTNALHQALKLLSGGSIDVQAAVALQNAALLDLNSAWKDGVDQSKGYQDSLLNVDGSLNTATENGQALFSKLGALRDQTADAAKATYDYAKANGSSLPDALKQAEGAMQTSWDAAVTTAQNLGLTKDQAQQLAAQLDLLPSNLAITLGVQDMNPTKASLLYVQGLADHLKAGATVKVGALTKDALALLQQVGIVTETLPDGTVKVTVPDGEVWAKLKAIADAQIPDKYFNVIPLGPSAGQSRSMGYADGGLVKRFADGGVLHAADGMTVPGYAPRQDTVPAMLSPGEGVLVPEAVRQLGGERAISTINRASRTGGLAVGTSSMAVSSGRGGGGTTVIHHTTVHVHGSVLTERELKDVMEEQMLRQGANNSTTWQQFARR